jgi:hypothetical protein
MHWVDNWKSYLADEMVFEVFCIQDVVAKLVLSIIVPDCLLFGADVAGHEEWTYSYSDSISEPCLISQADFTILTEGSG